MKASIASVLPAALLVPAQDTFNNPIIWSLGTDGLTLSTATVTTNLYAARNTLTHRVVGSRSSGTFRINVRDLTVEDIAGVAILRDDSAYIGARKEADGNVTLVHVSDITMEQGDDGWQTVSEDSVAANTTEGLEGVRVVGAGPVAKNHGGRHSHVYSRRGRPEHGAARVQHRWGHFPAAGAGLSDPQSLGAFPVVPRRSV